MLGHPTRIRINEVALFPNEQSFLFSPSHVDSQRVLTFTDVEGTDVEVFDQKYKPEDFFTVAPIWDNEDTEQSQVFAWAVFNDDHPPHAWLMPCNFGERTDPDNTDYYAKAVEEWQAKYRVPTAPGAPFLDWFSPYQDLRDARRLLQISLLCEVLGGFFLYFVGLVMLNKNREN